MNIDFQNETFGTMMPSRSKGFKNMYLQECTSFWIWTFYKFKKKIIHFILQIIKNLDDMNVTTRFLRIFLLNVYWLDFNILLLTARVTTLGMANSHSVTNNVYKARVQIHCPMLTSELLVIPASCKWIVACSSKWGQVFEISLLSQGCDILS